LDSGDHVKIREELADLLFEVVLQVQLASELGHFTMEDVVYDVSSKLVRRHPHVFAHASANTPESVIEQWDDLKAKERGQQSAVAGIPATLPALAYAQALQRRVAKTGFEWESDEQFWDALTEELEEFRAADDAHRGAEAGDALFALVNLLRSGGVDAEDALRLACRRFTARFTRIEALAMERGLDFAVADLDAKLGLWEEAKRGD
jgi:tetrapyrrole methylase family protein/MazG family protein